ncbi:MAG: hypothetical protein ACPL4E_07215 [Thermoproteota archaeon]
MPSFMTPGSGFRESGFRSEGSYIKKPVDTVLRLIALASAERV